MKLTKRNKKKINKLRRSAVSGRFVSKQAVKDNPKETVTEKCSGKK